MKIVPSNTAQTLIYVVAPVEIPHSTVFFLLPATSLSTSHEGVTVWRNGKSTWVLTDTEHTNGKILDSCDAAVFVIDGNVGMNPITIDLYRAAQDLSLPIHIAVHNSIAGRADFDEVVAIVRRVLDQDAVARYLPIESDEGDGIAGLFDLLTSDILLLTDGEITKHSSDPEHVNLTLDKRAELIEVLTHLALNDQQLESLNSGAPISIPKLENAFGLSGLTQITPIDEGAGKYILTDWQNHLSATWLPTVTNGESVSNIDEVSYPVGIAIAKGLVRFWNSDRAIWLERVNSRSAITDAIECRVKGGFMWVNQTTQGDYLRPAESKVKVNPPQF